MTAEDVDSNTVPRCTIQMHSGQTATALVNSKYTSESTHCNKEKRRDRLVSA